MLTRSTCFAAGLAVLLAVAASGAFPLPPLPGMFPASAGGDSTNSPAAASASLSKKPASEMSAAEYVAAANAPRETKTAAGVQGNTGTGFQWDDVLKAGREGKLDLNTNEDPTEAAAAAAAAAPATSADAATTAAVPAPVAAPAKRTPPSQLPVASPAAGAAAKSAAAWAEVMEAGRKGTLPVDTTGVKAGGSASAAAAAPAVAAAAAGAAATP